MKPVDQTIIDPKRGDCARAVIASLLDLEIEAVPHFNLAGPLWLDVEVNFMHTFGWEWEGSGYDMRALREEESIDGFFYASVPSRTYTEGSHAVVMDMNGIVAHDPNPNKKWQGVKVYGTPDLRHWSLYSRRKDWMSMPQVQEYLNEKYKQ